MSTGVAKSPPFSVALFYIPPFISVILPFIIPFLLHLELSVRFSAVYPVEEKNIAQFLLLSDWEHARVGLHSGLLHCAEMLTSRTLFEMCGIETENNGLFGGLAFIYSANGVSERGGGEEEWRRYWKRDCGVKLHALTCHLAPVWPIH